MARGEIRLTLSRALRAAAAPLTTRALAERTGIGYTAARRTVENMRRAGEVALLGSVRVEGTSARAGLYVLAPDCAPAPAVSAFDTLKSWTAAIVATGV